MIHTAITSSLLVAALAILASSCSPASGVRDEEQEGRNTPSFPTGGVRKATPDVGACGPEIGGLALGLVVSDTGTGADTDHVVTLTISNVGPRPVTLVGQVLRRDPARHVTYADAVIRGVSFTIFPVLPDDHAQTKVDPTEPTDVSQTIAPGEQFVVTGWSKGDHLQLDNGAGTVGQQFRFTSPGKYFVRARLYVSLMDGVDASLWSNEQPFTVGHSQATPVPPFAFVERVSSDSRTVELGVGSLHGVEVGDTYYLAAGKGALGFRVTEVGYRNVTATLDPSHSAGAKTLPKRGDRLERAYLP